MAEATDSTAPANPFAALAPIHAPSTALAQSDAQRAVAEVQAALVIARMNPRDPKRAMDLILQDCTRPGLAERAIYAYARGGSDISGPSIRLAEAVAQRWGNLQYGVRELEQRDGESVVQAYAWDVETNTRREVTFTVPHVRDTKRGRVRLEDARDIYEMTANNGARRVRACILGVIPGDVIEAAQKQCELTLTAKANVTPERIGHMLEVFASYGVTKEHVEARIQRRVDAITPALLLQLGKIANSLKDAMSSPADWFEIGPTPIRDVQRKPAEPVATAQKPAPQPPAQVVQAPEPEKAAAAASAPKPEPVAEQQPPRPMGTPDPDQVFHIKGIVRPNPDKTYVIVTTVEGLVFHVWDTKVQTDIQAAKAASLGMHLTGELTQFSRAPFRVTAIAPVFPTNREPGSDDE